jgi:hypothetical protein
VSCLESAHLPRLSRPRTTSTRSDGQTRIKHQQLLAVPYLIARYPSQCRRTCPTFSQTQRPNTTRSDAISYQTKSTATPKTTLTYVGHYAHTTLSKTKPSHHGFPMIPSDRRQCRQHRRLHPACDNNHHNKHPQSMHLKEAVVEAD